MSKLKLPREFAEKWIKALKSGEYKQGRHTLYDNVDDEKVYCCLGVACLVGGATEEDLLDYYGDPSEKIEEEYQQNITPEELWDESDLAFLCYNMNDGLTFNSTSYMKRKELIQQYIGDRTEPFTFEEIADWLEKNVEFYD